MMNSVRVSVEDLSGWRWQALAWAVVEEAHEDGFVAFLNNNGIDYPNDPFPNRLFVGAKRVISFSDKGVGYDAFDVLRQAHREKPSYLVGYLGYDLKNQLETLTSRNPDRLQFPDVYFVEPAWIIDFEQSEVLGDAMIIQGEGDTSALLKQLRSFNPAASPVFAPASPAIIQCRVTPDEYMATVRRIQEYIRAGDVYELNYCIEFFAQDAGHLDPLATYRALNERSPMPFSSFMKLGDRYVMGASPERFLKKTGSRILSQPIKGTVRRGQTPEEDAALRAYLLNSEKERAENLMIVDLVRNDLARSAETGSVGVDELFGIYGFRPPCTIAFPGLKPYAMPFRWGV